MNGPFSRVNPNGTPTWTTAQPNNGNFTQVNVLGQGYTEVGYGEGGYGADGYDSPTVNAQAAPLPNWVTGSSE